MALNFNLKVGFGLLVRLMLLTTATLVAGSALPVKRQLPACTDACVVRLGTPEWGCNLEDVRCLCLNQAFMEAMTDCVHEECEGDDVDLALQGIDALCEAAGAGIPPE
ncbi:hypothetical protein H1R20_g10873, partial [Candolleomyces eurysporus]